MLATLAYYALTTGSGLQTLGEEYCDVLQIKRSGVLLSPSARTALVALQSFGPYLADRVVRGLEHGGSADVWGDPDHAFVSRSGSCSPPLSDDDDGETAGMSSAGGAASSSRSPEANHSREMRHQSGPPPRRRDRLRVAGRGTEPHPAVAAAVPASPAQLLAKSLGAARHRLRCCHSALAARWPLLKPWVLFAGRAHLALFYYYGVYYEWSKRVAGVQFTSMAKQQGSRWAVAGRAGLLQQLDQGRGKNVVL